jgi:ferritin-like metal-binding protein YciE
MGVSDMADSSLRDAFIDELRDAYDAEHQILKALPKMVKKATNKQLKAAFAAHLEETRGQVDRLEKAFKEIDARIKGKHCEGLAGILKEGKTVKDQDYDDATMDACLIAAAQRVEHYEIAAYGTMIAWAKCLGEAKVVKLLEETLKQEDGADKKLTGLAEDGINQSSMEAAAIA